jgi:nicotinate phosphoribosyltransferase
MKHKHFFLPEDARLFDYDQIFSVSSLWVELGMEKVTATFDLLVRNMPKNRNFLIFGGLDEIIEAIKNWKFTEEEIKFLLDNQVITEKMASLLKDYKFSGDIHAMPEGTIFFPNEPIVRLTGYIWEINLFTFFLMNAITSNTIPLSKIVRSNLAAEGKVKVITCPVTRAHSHESSLKFGRAAYLLGHPSGMVPGFAKKFNLKMTKPSTKAYHAFIQSFPDELEAMRKAAEIFPEIGFMIDTYDVKNGLENTIIVAKEGRKISSVVLDSGKNVTDYINQAKYVRERLNSEGLFDIKITVAGNFNENKILEIKDAPIDSVILSSEAIVSADSPKLDVVLKLAEINVEGVRKPCAKLSNGKESYPGKKQVFRTIKDGCIHSDIIGLEDEDIGAPLLKCMISNGNFVYQSLELDQIKEYTLNQINSLPFHLKDITRDAEFKVAISERLQNNFDEFKKSKSDLLKEEECDDK